MLLAPSMRSLCDEFTKIAFGADAAQKVLRIAKGLQLPKASFKAPALQTMGELGGGGSVGLMGIGTPARRRQGFRVLGHMLNRVEKEAPSAYPMLRDELASPGLQQMLHGVGQLGGSRGAVVPGKGSPVTQIRQITAMNGMGELPHVNPDQQKMLHAVLKGHELDEVNVRPGIGFRDFGHNSPDVILREHNRVVTLPRENAPVGDFMKAIRGGREAEYLNNATHGRFQYGESPRLSRHARRRITDLLNNRTEDAQIAAMKQMEGMLRG